MNHSRPDRKSSPLVFASDQSAPAPGTMLLTAIGVLGLWRRVRRMKIAV
jgi:hypothetical protein